MTRHRVASQPPARSQNRQPNASVAEEQTDRANPHSQREQENDDDHLHETVPSQINPVDQRKMGVA
jgi:hypothetical protein